MPLRPRPRLTPILLLSVHTWLCSGLLHFLLIFYYVFQTSSLIQSSWPHQSPGSAEGPGTVLSSLCRRKASQLTTAPHLFGMMPTSHWGLECGFLNYGYPITTFWFLPLQFYLIKQFYGDVVHLENKLISIWFDEILQIHGPKYLPPHV